MRATSVILALCFGSAAFAQSGTRRAYEVASVKLNNSGSPSTRTPDYQGQIVLTNLSLERLIQRAYGVSPAQIAGPEWAGSRPGGRRREVPCEGQR